MSRPTIHCPSCQRELFNLRRPHCLWCGAQISPEQFEQVAAPPPSAIAPTLPLPPMPILPFGYGPTPFRGSFCWRRLIPWNAIHGSVSPWERKLRIAGAALAACLLLGKTAELFWMLWRMHQTMLPLH